MERSWNSRKMEQLWPSLEADLVMLATGFKEDYTLFEDVQDTQLKPFVALSNSQGTPRN